MGKIILVLGGARSGKSTFALEQAKKTGERVLFVATSEPVDAEMVERIINHRKERPASWRTLEAPLNVGTRLKKEIGDSKLVIVDCITVLLGNIFGKIEEKDFENVAESDMQEKVMAEIYSLIESCRQINATVYIISNEVGNGIVPDNRAGRLYRDLLGKANQRLAKAADEVYLLVAGIPLRIKPQNNSSTPL